MIVGLDAKRIVRNGTGLGSYGRTLVNDLIRLSDNQLELRLYAPDEGRSDLREQVIEGVAFCHDAVVAFPGNRVISAEDEKRRLDIVCGKDVQHLIRVSVFRPALEGKSHCFCLGV